MLSACFAISYFLIVIVTLSINSGSAAFRGGDEEGEGEKRSGRVERRKGEGRRWKKGGVFVAFLATVNLHNYSLPPTSCPTNYSLPPTSCVLHTASHAADVTNTLQLTNHCSSKWQHLIDWPTLPQILIEHVGGRNASYCGRSAALVAMTVSDCLNTYRWLFRCRWKRMPRYSN